MGFSSVKSYVDAMESGQIQISNYRKVSASAVVLANSWYDLSVLGTTPRPNFYASSPLESKRLNPNFGIYHGQYSGSKQLSEIYLGPPPANTTHTHMLCDYLLYYPFIDGDSTAEQTLTQVDVLDRYEDGIGVMAILVSQGTYVGGQQYFITYTNDQGVSGRISQTMTANTVGITGAILSESLSSPFIRLCTGDTGIRSIESITFLSSIGGIHALVLVRPLAWIAHDSNGIGAEKVFPLMTGSLPEIKSTAYVNFLTFSPVNWTAAVPLTGSLTFTWGND